METAQDVAKDREERYNRMLRLITNYHRSKQEMKDVEQMKRETLFEIAMRFKRSESNKNYVFPRGNAEEAQPLTQQEIQLSGRRDLQYNLNRQAVVVENQETKPKRSTIERMETELVIPEKQRTQKVALRPLLHRIDMRIQRQLVKEMIPHSTRQLTDKSPTDKSNEKLFIPLGSARKMPLIQQALQKNSKFTDQREATGPAFDIIRRDRSTPLVPIHKTTVTSKRTSPSNERRAGDRVITEEATVLVRGGSSKKIHTEQSNETGLPLRDSPNHPSRKLRLQIRMPVDANKIEMLMSGLSSIHHGLKPKNLFQKQAF